MGKTDGLEKKKRSKPIYTEPQQQEQVILFCVIWRKIFDSWMILFLDSFGYEDLVR